MTINSEIVVMPIAFSFFAYAVPSLRTASTPRVGQTDPLPDVTWALPDDDSVC
jgi:hypothetical protein